MIEVNLECGNVDEEFFHLLANAYLADPELLIETILDLPQEDIAYLAKAIAYDLQKTQRQDAVQTNFADPAAAAVGRLIALETADTGNASLDAFLDEDMMAGLVTGETPDADLLVLEEFAGAALSLPADTAEVNSPVSATISFGSTLAASTARSYRIRFYKQQENEKMLCGSSLAVIPPNQMTASLNANLTFNATGVYQVYAEIYNSAGELFGTSPSVTVTVWGQWHIDVVLPVDRDYKGTLTLYDASGTVCMTAECLGRSGSNADPSIYYGNTPTGYCEAWLGGPETESNHGSYGPYKYIILNPIFGDMKDYTNRGGFLIHGGSPETNTSLDRYPLRPTNGCIRVSNANQLLLENKITNLVDEEYHYTVGTVSITEQE